MLTAHSVLRGLVVIMLVLLFAQYAFGMKSNFELSSAPPQPSISFSVNGVMQYLTGPASAALIHAFSGLFEFLFSFGILFFAAKSHQRVQIILAILGTVGLLGAMYFGLSFVLSGLQTDAYSFGMALAFIFTFSVYFLELYCTKSPR